MDKYQTFEYDVVVVGAGGAGLRAAIEASAQGAKTALVCKSLLGKAHTVMAEGGVAAALANVENRDSWQTHFRDTMRGGKFLESMADGAVACPGSSGRACASSKNGARCSIARRMGGFCSGISAATRIRGWRTSAIAPASR